MNVDTRWYFAVHFCTIIHIGLLAAMYWLCQLNLVLYTRIFMLSGNFGLRLTLCSSVIADQNQTLVSNRIFVECNVFPILYILYDEDVRRKSLNTLWKNLVMQSKGNKFFSNTSILNLHNEIVLVLLQAYMRRLEDHRHTPPNCTLRVAYRQVPSS